MGCGGCRPEDVRRSLRREAHTAQRELERRVPEHRFGGPALERWLRFLIRHEETVGSAAADEARSLIVGMYGIHVWNALIEAGARHDICARHREAMTALLTLQHEGVENPWTSRTIRRVAFDVLFERAVLDEGQGEA